MKQVAVCSEHNISTLCGTMQCPWNITAGGTYSNHCVWALYITNCRSQIHGALTIVSRGSVMVTYCLFHWTSLVHFTFRKMFKGWSYYSPRTVLITYTACWYLWSVLTRTRTLILMRAMCVVKLCVLCTEQHSSIYWEEEKYYGLWRHKSLY